MAISPGTIIDGRYAVEAALGEGGMGVVLRAKHTFTGALCAVKVLHPHLRLQDNLAARFMAEARAPATIGHPGIVRITDAGRTPEGDLYLVMELLEGETLKARMARGPVPFDAVRRVLTDVLDALGAAHAAGLVHRDLKPDNVFLCKPNDAVKLLDFGIVKVVREGQPDSHAATTTGAVLGTLTYMSPEQLRDPRQVDLRTDLWAVGVMLYELVTGLRPYEADTFGEMVAALLTGPPRPLGEQLAQAPEGLDALIQRALTHDPRQRFGSAAEMAAALRSLPAAPIRRRGMSAPTLPMGPPSSSAASTSPGSAPPSPAFAALAAVTVPGAPLSAPRESSPSAGPPPLAGPRAVPPTPMDGLMARPRPPSLAAPTLVGPYEPPPMPMQQPSSGMSRETIIALAVGGGLFALLLLGAALVALFAFLR
ncbi:MAG: protein kinase [Byssovorax sp.]